MAVSYKKRIGIITLVMALLILAALLITVFTGASHKRSARLNIVASFLPVYSAALQVTNGVDGVKVTNLVPPQTGCMHDYQLTPDNVIALSQADALILNGAGAESFLVDIKTQYPKLNIIDTSEGVPLKEGNHHHHHEEEEEAHEQAEEEMYNEHIWTGPSGYIKQIQNLCDALTMIDPDHADQYSKNAEEYISKIEALKSELAAAVSGLPTKNCVLFHDSLSYFADELGLKAIASMSMGEESALSAAELAEAAAAAGQAGKVLLIYDNQYNAEYTSVSEKASFSREIKLDMAVTDNDGKAADAWLNAMRKNVQLLKEAAK